MFHQLILRNHQKYFFCNLAPNQSLVFSDRILFWLAAFNQSYLSWHHWYTLFLFFSPFTKIWCRLVLCLGQWLVQLWWFHPNMVNICLSSFITMNVIIRWGHEFKNPLILCSLKVSSVKHCQSFKKCFLQSFLSVLILVHGKSIVALHQLVPHHDKSKNCTE